MYGVYSTSNCCIHLQVFTVIKGEIACLQHRGFPAHNFLSWPNDGCFMSPTELLIKRVLNDLLGSIEK
jgi:hypothetical protein